MSDLSALEVINLSGFDSTLYGFAIPERFKYLQEIWIQVSIKERLSSVGSVDKKSPNPRIWSGYYYLFHDNCIFKYGAVEFQNQEIYRERNNSWNAEVAANENAFNLSTPEVPPDIDNFDELAEVDLWLGTSDLKNIYLPTQLRIDRVEFYLPVGVAIDINICGQKFSPISATGTGNDIDLYADDNGDGIPDFLIPSPPNPFQFPPPDIDNIVSSFDDMAAQRGYILQSTCDLINDENTKSIVANSGLSSQQILDKLLALGSVLQGDIDAILALNPSASPDVILDTLIDNGIASNPEVSEAVSAVLATSPYPSNPTKKYSWFVIFYEKIGAGCPDVYKAIRCFLSLTNVNSVAEVYSGSAYPSASSINWTSVVRGDSPYSLNAGWDLYEALSPIVACGQTKTFYQAAINNVGIGNVYRSATTPQVVWLVQP